MADVLTPEQRHRSMSAIRSKGNRTTELALVRLLRELHITGWRRHVKLPGRPDFAFRAARVLVFVDGCFWHGCPRCYTKPGTNRRFWADKVTTNRARDRRQTRELRGRGWAVVRIWEHELKRPAAARRKLRLVGLDPATQL
ncbi:MAG: very short patch repair endonuclease [Candidatus Eisenbacteria bacterium]|uniref:Very short patch repair endonuclease n=1 Tax=Eiseniibacteriota bacterium TaxID=2212470 RepID=A0A933S916_UNCEI|nr:very short patch repair endonuclease [Candidatus Eisenbacteria bacterium]